MASAKLDIILEEGSSWQKQILWTDASNNPISLNNYWARLGVLQDLDDAASAQHISVDADKENLRGSVITIGEGTGIIDVLISATDVDNAMSTGWKRGCWGLEILPSASTKVLGGSFTDWNFDAINAGNSNNATITANHASAALGDTFSEHDYVVIRGCAESSNDGMYKIVGTPSTTVINFDRPGAVDKASGNTSLKIFKPDEAKCVKLIGGKVRTNQSAVLRRSVNYET